MRLSLTALAAVVLPCVVTTDAQDVAIRVDARQASHRLSHFLTGACIEDVNHEIYGGLYSQMLFGESFQEPPLSVPPRGFKAFGGEWRVEGEVLHGGAGDGPRLVSDLPPLGDGTAGVEVMLADRRGGKGGFILRVGANAGVGADTFDGYELSLDAAAQVLTFGRHRYDWEHIRDVPCEVPVGQWIPLVVTLRGRRIEASVGGKKVLEHDDGARALITGAVGLRQWQREAAYRNLWIETDGAKRTIAFEGREEPVAVSGMWRPVRRGEVRGRFAIEREGAFVGAQSQRLALESGAGELGVENQGLNRWGLHVEAGKPYEGVVWARAEQAVDLWAALESGDGARTLAATRLAVAPGDWRRLEFTLAPEAAAEKARFSLLLKQPGSVALGHAFLQPGKWGRYKGLPVRRDVAEALVDQGITVLRYGGSMVNCDAYRWKQMIGPRDRRQPYRGTWYPYSSNGWAILDFMDFCEAAGFEYVPTFYMGETPEDLADFIEYAKGAEGSEWGQKRDAAGRAATYRLRYLQLGNEERVDEAYASRFEAAAAAIWARDPEIVLVVGDFVYSQPIRDPDQVTGAASRITNLRGQQRILELAKRHGREVWFDVHVGTDGPRPDRTFAAMLTYVDALEKLADGARHRVVVFEFNSGNHSHRRGLANALAIQAIQRDGRIPVALSANCLQPDGQNDNGWDQGLLFLNPSRVWLQSPGWVTRMVARTYQPLALAATVAGTDQLDVSARRSEDGKVLVIQAVNAGDQPLSAKIVLEGFSPRKPLASVEELAAPLDAVNTAAAPDRVVPAATEWRHALTSGQARRDFAPRSITVLRLE